VDLERVEQLDAEQLVTQLVVEGLDERVLPGSM
jgi:hypothetical protein